MRCPLTSPSASYRQPAVYPECARLHPQACPMTPTPPGSVLGGGGSGKPLVGPQSGVSAPRPTGSVGTPPPLLGNPNKKDMP